MQDSQKCLMAAIERQHLGLVLRLLYQQFRHRFESGARAHGLDDVTIVHSRVLGFLARHQEEDIFQRDIEAAFRISRSTVTSIMQVMEKNDLIERRSVAADNRLKKVALTPHGLDMHRRTVALIDEAEAQLRAGITEQELTAFFSIAKKIEENLM